MKKQDLVCVFKGDAFEAEVVKARLESEGILAMIMNHSMSAIFFNLYRYDRTYLRYGQSAG